MIVRTLLFTATVLAGIAWEGDAFFAPLSAFPSALLQLGHRDGHGGQQQLHRGGGASSSSVVLSASRRRDSPRSDGGHAAGFLAGGRYEGRSEPVYMTSAARPWGANKWLLGHVRPLSASIGQAPSDTEPSGVDADSSAMSHDADTAPDANNSTHYIQCSFCKSAYIVDLNKFDKDFKVRCSVCGKVWFQRRDLVFALNESRQTLVPLSEDKVRAAQDLIAQKKSPRAALSNKVSVFVGNLPLSYNENDILDLFAEYGVVQVSMGRVTPGVQKGFAFIEVSSVRVFHHIGLLCC